MTAGETAALLELDEPAVLAAARGGDLPGRQIGGHWRFSTQRDPGLAGGRCPASRARQASPEAPEPDGALAASLPSRAFLDWPHGATARPSAPAAVNSVRFARRPLELLARWHARYGDVFTVSMIGFGTGVYVVDPDAIRELFTGDQSDLRAGEANSFMEPVLGPHSVLVLDGPEHLRQRKLLLRPFQGSRVAAFREVIREVAERELASWRPGTQLVLRERMRALTFEVICRAVFGVTQPERVERLRERLVAVIDSSPIFVISPAARADLGPLSPGGRFARRLRAADAVLYEEIERRRRRARSRRALGRALAAAARPGRAGPGDDVRRAARRAVHDARRGA